MSATPLAVHRATALQHSASAFARRDTSLKNASSATASVHAPSRLNTIASDACMFVKHAGEERRGFAH